MRSVKAARKSRSSARNKPNRRAQSPARAPVERIVLGKKSAKRNGMLSRAWAMAASNPLARRPMFHLTWFLIVLSFIAALFAGGYVSGTFKAAGRGIDNMIANAGFSITAIQLSGNAHTQPAQIHAALGIEPGQSIFGADIQGARARLMALDWVADAQIRRQYPGSIAVSIVEKLPFALWQMPSGLFLVERSGRVITRVQGGEFPRLPLFLGAGAAQDGAELVDAIATHRAVFARVKAMQRVSERRWNLLLDDHVIVELPETGWAQQLDELEHLIVDKGVLERDISEIDLRSPDNLFFQLRNGDKQQMTRGNAT